MLVEGGSFEIFESIGNGYGKLDFSSLRVLVVNSLALYGYGGT